MATSLQKTSKSLNTNLSFKLLTKRLLDKELFEMAEMLAPNDERDSENSFYWQWEYSKALSIQPECNHFVRRLIGSIMLCNIGS